MSLQDAGHRHQKALTSVSRICDAGHKVTFTRSGGIMGPEATDQRTEFQRLDNVHRVKVGVAEEQSVFRRHGMRTLMLARRSL